MIEAEKLNEKCKQNNNSKKTRKRQTGGSMGKMDKATEVQGKMVERRRDKKTSYSNSLQSFTRSADFCKKEWHWKEYYTTEKLTKI